MELYDFIFLAAWFIGGFVSGISGMGAAMVAVPMLVSFINPSTLIPVSCLISTLICVYLTWVYYKTCLYSVIKRMIIGCIPGSILGVYILMHMDAKYIQLLAGVTLLFFVCLQITRARTTLVQREERLHKSLFVGFVSGVLNSSLSFGGPPVGAYALYLGWNQAQFMGTMNVFGLLLLLIVNTFQGIAGLFTPEVLSLASKGALASVLGAMCATPFVKIIPLNTFKFILLIIIATGGISCIWKGLGL